MRPVGRFEPARDLRSPLIWQIRRDQTCDRPRQNPGHRVPARPHTSFATRTARDARETNPRRVPGREYALHSGRGSAIKLASRLDAIVTPLARHLEPEHVLNVRGCGLASGESGRGTSYFPRK